MAGEREAGKTKIGDSEQDGRRAACKAERAPIPNEDRRGETERIADGKFDR